MKFEEEIMKAQRSQELNMNLSIEGTDENTFMKSFQEILYESYDRESFEKAWSKDLQSKFPSGGWRTINGAKVFINNGKVIAGLDGFNGAIDKFFEEKKGKSEGKGSSKLQERTDKLLKEYYEKDKGIKEKVVKRGVAESTAKIDAKKRGSEFSVKPDENEKGKFKVVHNVKGDAEGLSFEQYKDKYGDQLSVTAKNQIDYKDKNEGKGSDSKSLSKESKEEIKERIKEYKSLSEKERNKKRDKWMSNIMELKTDLEKQTDEKVKEVYEKQLKYWDELFTEKNKADKELNIPILKQSDKQFLEGSWKFGGTRKELVEGWTEQALQEVGKGKKFNTKEEAAKEVMSMAKVIKGIDDEKYRAYKMVAENLK
jgi:hypothetical protein